MRERGSRLAWALALGGSIALTSSLALAARQPVPHSGGGGHVGAPAGHGTATRSGVPPHGQANGTAHYGYGGVHVHGGYWGGYWGYPYWGWGWGWGWGWPYYGYYGYPYYGYPYYGGYPYYSYGPPPQPSGPAVIETDVAPKNAQVILDGEAIGNAKDWNGTWDELHIDPGHHTLEFRHAGYRSLVVDLNASPGGFYSFRDTLVAGSGEDRRTVGPPPSSEHGSYGSASGNHPQDATPAHEGATPGIARGLLRVQAAPEDASVYLDGQFLGVGRELAALHGAIPVATGEHRLEVVRPGFAAVTKTVSVGLEGTTDISVSLEPGH